MAKRGRLQKYNGRKFMDEYCSGGMRGIKLGWDSYGKQVIKRKTKKYKNQEVENV